MAREFGPVGGVVVPPVEPELEPDDDPVLLPLLPPELFVVPPPAGALLVLPELGLLVADDVPLPDEAEEVLPPAALLEPLGCAPV